MAKDKPGALEIRTFADHHVITQPNPLRKVLRRVGGEVEVVQQPSLLDKARSTV